MKKTPNAQFNFADPDSLAVRVATKVRQDLFRMFISEMKPAITDYILDVGVTSDQSYSSSNYFEALYPYKDRVVTVGLQNDFIPREGLSGHPICASECASYAIFGLHIRLRALLRGP
jgi:hypothetical protein